MRPIELETELKEHHRAAFGWALSCCRWDRSMAEDVLQASYLKILDGRAHFLAHSGFRTWIFGVIRRTAAEHYRSWMWRRFVPLASLDGHDKEIPSGDDAESGLTHAESNARLVSQLRSLPRRQRELLHLVFYQDLTIEEAAAVLGISVGTARTHYQRGKRRLRERLQEDAG